MALVNLPAAQANAAVDAMFPSAPRVRTATATNGTSTLTFGDVAGIEVGMSATGAGITSGGVVTGISGNIVTLGGTITTLTATTYTFTLAASASLHTASPGLTGASEVANSGGSSYARQPISYGGPSLGIEQSTNAQNWTGMPACTVTWFGNWSAVSNFIGGGQLTSSLTVPSGATVAAAIGALAVGVQG